MSESFWSEVVAHAKPTNSIIATHNVKILLLNLILFNSRHSCINSRHSREGGNPARRFHIIITESLRDFINSLNNILGYKHNDGGFFSESWLLTLSCFDTILA